VSAPTLVVLLGVRESRRQERRMLPADGKCPAISAAERRAGVARCYLSKLTGKLIEKEKQLSAAVTIGGETYKATIDTRATASFISKELVQQASEDDDTTKFLEAELSSFNTMTGTSNMAEHQITMKDDKSIKQRQYPKNPKVQGEINAKVDELLQMGYIEHELRECHQISHSNHFQFTRNPILRDHREPF